MVITCASHAQGPRFDPGRKLNFFIIYFFSFFFTEVYTFLFSQVAHFYNTIDRQMIPSQQAMMLEAALAFEHIIKNPKAGVKNGNEVRLSISTEPTCTVEDNCYLLFRMEFKSHGIVLVS